MGDLAQALVSLSSAARGRRTARARLEEAAATTARAIVKHLRVGDLVAVKDSEYSGPNSNVTVNYHVVKLTWHVDPFEKRLDPKGASVLCRAGNPLHDEREAHDEAGEYVDPDIKKPVSLPRAADLHYFSQEAADVIAGFAKLLDKQERSFVQAASGLAELKPNGGNRHRYTLEQLSKKLAQFMRARRTPFEIKDTIEGFVFQSDRAELLLQEGQGRMVEMLTRPGLTPLFGMSLDSLDNEVREMAELAATVLFDQPRS
jgi:hypothetical protein